LSKVLIRGATVVTMNDADAVLTPGDVVIDGARLAYVGPPDDVVRVRFDDEVTFEQAKAASDG
jgi:hypothetical protein